MSEMITIFVDELKRLEERARRSAADKSYLQLVIRLMNQVSAASGLEDTIECLLRNVLDVIGGTNIVLYYWIDGEIFSTDVYGKKRQLPAIDDELVEQVVATREPLELDLPFTETKLTTPEFTKAHTWVYPLQVGPDLLGVFKMENLHIGVRELSPYLPTFFSFVALALKNEILGYTQLQRAHDRLSEANARLTSAIDERSRVEEALRAAGAALERRVAERTAELESANERLQHELVERERAQEALRCSAEEIIRLNEELEGRVATRTDDLETKRIELEESQKALMNIVEDLNEKTGELAGAYDKLKELDRLKSMFIASMSHELRTPLNSIIGFSSILHNEWIGPVQPEQKENLAIILRCGKHLLSLINDVIDVSKIEAGKIESCPEEFDLQDLIGEAVDFVKKDLEEKGLSLHVATTPQPMVTDRRRLLQCVLNLLSNAVKFTNQGSVTVEARIIRDVGAVRETVAAEIAVSDTGVGIREEDLPRMFQPFVRLSSPLQPTVPGTGLGLYLTRKLAAEVLNGTILLASEFGKGSRFALRVPVRVK